MFKINKYIALNLQHGKTVVLLGGSEFLVCKAVFVDINKDLDEEKYNTIDEVVDDEDKRIFVPLNPKEEFWVHCSNIQAWAENSYNTALLHSNIAFPLLEELVRLGDSLAKKTFKDEIVRRLLMDYVPTIIYLLNRGYLDMFTDEEFDTLLSEVRRKPYSLNKRVLDLILISDDFDEVPPIDRLSARTILFLIEHPYLNLFELFFKFGHLYLKTFSEWIFKSLDRLVKKNPEFFWNKIDFFLKKGYLRLPVMKSTPDDVKLDYSEMDDFSILFFNKYLREKSFIHETLMD